MFYSLPPAGSNVSIRAILKAFKEWGLGSKVDARDILKDVGGRRYYLYLSSGRAALWLILRALCQLRFRKQEVIIPAYTCPAVVSAVLKAGLKPLLADINLTDFGLSIKELNGKITADTLAVIVVHLFGYPANIDEIQECCRDRKVFVIEDAAQAFGNAVLDSPNKKLGLMGDAGVFSFGRGKPLNVMHGGILVTNSEAIYEGAKKIYESIKHGSRFQYLKYFFMVGSYWAFSKPYLYWIPGGLPFLHLGETSFETDFVIAKGDNFARAIIDEMVSFLEEDKGTRAKNSSWYASNLEGLPFIRTPPSPCFPYLRYPFMVEGGRLRDGILKRLSSHGTGAALFYPSPLNELPGLKEILKDSNCYPNAEKLSKMLITLPVHGGVKQSDRQRIKTIIEQVIKDECQPFVISH